MLERNIRIEKENRTISAHQIKMPQVKQRRREDETDEEVRAVDGWVDHLTGTRIV